jgi:hypothetical protein
MPDDLAVPVHQLKLGHWPGGRDWQAQGQATGLALLKTLIKSREVGCSIPHGIQSERCTTLSESFPFAPPLIDHITGLTVYTFLFVRSSDPNNISLVPCPFRVYGIPASAAFGHGPQALTGHHAKTAPTPPALWPFISHPNGTWLF